MEKNGKSFLNDKNNTVIQNQLDGCQCFEKTFFECIFGWKTEIRKKRKISKTKTRKNTKKKKEDEEILNCTQVHIYFIYLLLILCTCVLFSEEWLGEIPFPFDSNDSTQMMKMKMKKNHWKWINLFDSSIIDFKDYRIYFIDKTCKLQ